MDSHSSEQAVHFDFKAQKVIDSIPTQQTHKPCRNQNNVVMFGTHNSMKAAAVKVTPLRRGGCVMICKLIVVYSAFANSVLPGHLLEEQKNFEEEVYNALFVAGAGAVFPINLVKVYKCEAVFVRIGFGGGTGVAADGEVYIFTRRFFAKVAKCSITNVRCTCGNRYVC